MIAPTKSTSISKKHNFGGKSVEVTENKIKQKTENKTKQNTETKQIKNITNKNKQKQNKTKKEEKSFETIVLLFHWLHQF